MVRSCDLEGLVADLHFKAQRAAEGFDVAPEGVDLGQESPVEWWGLRVSGEAA